MQTHRSLNWVLLMVFLGNAAFAMTVATVNGVALTDGDLSRSLSNLNTGQKEVFLRDKNSKRLAIESLVDQELLAQQGSKDKLDQDSEYKEALAWFKKQYLVNKVLEKKVATQLTEAAVQKYFNEHRNRFSTDRVHAYHILLDSEESARSILKKATVPKADFQKLAEDFSKDPKAKNNRGDIGFFTREVWTPEFSDAAFGGKVGEVVGPIKTNFGYHIIKIVEKKFGKPLEYHEVEFRAKNELQERLTQDYVSSLKSGAKIQVNE